MGSWKQKVLPLGSRQVHQGVWGGGVLGSEEEQERKEGLFLLGDQDAQEMTRRQAWH